jgi:hypothetical protein
MDEYARDRISKEFADLTAQLEDAAGLAVRGQSLRQSVAAVRGTHAQLSALLKTCEHKLASAERALVRAETGQGP